MTWAEENRAWLEAADLHWSPRRVAALLLRAWLDAPVACDLYDWVTIEGALQAAVCLRETGRAPDDVFAGCPPDASVAETDIRIPIADTVVGENQPVALASIGWFSPDAIATNRQSWKRADPELYGSDRVKISMAEAKTQMVLKATVTASHLDFYVAGDRALLEDLLRDACVLGAGRGGGLGAVRGWEVLPGQPWWWIGPSCRLMRTLPERTAVEMGAARFESRVATIRAPYWHRRTRCEAAVPVQVLGEQLDASPDLRYGGQ
jgi:hypothetical protein